MTEKHWGTDLYADNGAAKERNAAEEAHVRGERTERAPRASVEDKAPHWSVGYLAGQADEQ